MLKRKGTLHVTFLMLVISSLLLITACENTDDDNSDKEIRQQEQLYPTGVTSGDVSASTYLEIERYFSSEENYNKNMMNKVNDITENPSIIEDDMFTQDFKKLLNEYEAYLKGFNLKPETRADFELFDIFNEMITNEKYVIQELRKSLDGDLSYHAKRASEYSNKKSIALDALINSLEKNSLLVDSD